MASNLSRPQCVKRPSRGLAIMESAEVTYSSAKEYIFEQGIQLDAMF